MAAHLRLVADDGTEPLPLLTGDAVWWECAQLLAERLSQVPLDDPVRGPLETWMRLGGMYPPGPEVSR